MRIKPVAMMRKPFSSSQSGNILFYILIAVVLIGALTVALRDTSGLDSGIDRDGLTVKATQVQRQAAGFAVAVQALIENGVSESDIRFAHPDANVAYGDITVNPTRQVFSPQGGQGTFFIPPTGIGVGGANIANWEFQGDVNGLESGTDKGDLVAVLPNVSQEFCAVINTQIGYTPGSQPAVPASTCVASSNRFVGTFDDSSPILLDPATFTRTPAYQACVSCDGGAQFDYFYVLLAR